MFYDMVATIAWVKEDAPNGLWVMIRKDVTRNISCKSYVFANKLYI